MMKTRNDIEGGWISIYRKITENPLYFSEPFTRMQAWIDMIIIANHKESFFYVRGNKVTVKRGEIGYSQQSLAIRWQWSRGKVVRFLKEIEKSGMIVQQKNSVNNIISIVKYDDYQQSGTTESATDGQQTVQQTDINNNDNKVNNDNKEIDTSISFKSKSKKFNFKKALLEYGADEKFVDEWITIRKSKKASNTELAFKNFIAEVEKTGMNINEVLKIVAVEKQWRGFKAEWLENDTNGKKYDKDVERQKWLMMEAEEAGMTGQGKDPNAKRQWLIKKEAEIAFSSSRSDSDPEKDKLPF